MTQDQYKRQTIVKTSHAFPSMHKRVPIVSKEEVRHPPSHVAEVSGALTFVCLFGSNHRRSFYRLSRRRGI